MEKHLKRAKYNLINRTAVKPPKAGKAEEQQEQMSKAVATMEHMNQLI